MNKTTRSPIHIKSSSKNSPYLTKHKALNHEAYRLLHEQKLNFIKEKHKEYSVIISDNEEMLSKVPEKSISDEVKEKYMKMKRGIMRRMIENKAHDEILRKWNLPNLKMQIIKMSKMERIELIEYKRMNGLCFYKS